MGEVNPPCPYCGSYSVGMQFRLEVVFPLFYLQCVECGSTGPTGKTEHDALMKYRKRYYPIGIAPGEEKRIP